jgi:DNA-binding GntR family transcriptional regulator
VEGAGNVTVGVLAGMLADIVEKHLMAEITGKRRHEDQLRDNRRAYLAHARLLGLVEARDAEGAQAFWSRHMEIAGDILLGEHGATKVLDLVV